MASDDTDRRFKKRAFSSSARPALPYSQTLHFPGGSVRIDSVVKYALEDIVQAYRHLVGTPGSLERPNFVIRRRRGKLQFMRVRECGEVDGTEIRRHCVMPIPEQAINQYVLETSPDRILLHAAAVAYRGQAIVLPGSAGSGKTTVAAKLVQEGCGYLSDELVIIDRQLKTVWPFLKALTLKPGSFSAFASLSPQPTGPPNARVWYLDPERIRPGSLVKTPLPIGRVILPRYNSKVTATAWQPLSLGNTVIRLFENMVNTSRHKEAGLDCLIQIAQRAPGCRLEFRSLGDASRLILNELKRPRLSPTS